MRYLTFNVGDDAWIYFGNHTGERTKGTVVAILDLSHRGILDPQYVIEVPSHIDSVFEVRNGVTMSDSADEDIGLYRRS